MVDHQTEIEALEAVLNSGALTVVVDGQTVTYRNSEDIERRIKALKSQDTTGRYRTMERPRCVTINLGGF